MAQKKKDIAGGIEDFEDYAARVMQLSPDGKFSTYSDQPGKGLDGHITLQERGKPEKT